jgi:PAS domain S-box-containing protein
MKDRNILEERESVNEIIEKDTLLFSIFNNKNLGICVTDDFGRFVKVNNQFCKTFGYTN